MQVGNNRVRHLGDQPTWARTDGDGRTESERPDPLFDALPHPAILTDCAAEDEPVVRVNAAFARSFDCERDAVVGEPVSDLLSIDEGDDPAVGGVRETADGTERPFRFRRVSVGGADDRDYGLYTDATDQTTYEARLTALHEAARRLQTAESAEGVLDIGVHTARDVLGYEVTAVYQYDDEFEVLTPSVTTTQTEALLGELPTLPAGDSTAWRAFERGAAVTCDDVREDPDVFNPDTPVRSELILPLGEYGVLVAGSTEQGAFRAADVSLGRVLAADLEAALKRVRREQQLRDREASLSRENDRLREFASVISHDLRTPLDLAGAHLELATEAGEDDGEHLDDVAAAHERMSDLIEDVLTWAREGDTVDTTATVSLPSLASECWDGHPTDAATLDVTTERAVEGDRSQLRQLFDNLFENALRYAGPDVTVTVGDLPEGGFFVADDGPGIPAAEREAVFDFGHTLSPEGTGFGLAIVARIVEAHGWSITVAESDDGGARFEIRL